MVVKSRFLISEVIIILVCTKCFEIYNINNIKKPFDLKEYFCPKINCTGEIHEIDELIYEAIKILNQKGYKTKHCCSGHLYDEPIQTYISFEKNIVIPSVPNNFGFNYEGNVIRKILDDYKNKNLSERLNYVIETHKDILDWVNDLPRFDRG